jgi:hypothetical protein
LAKTDTPFVAFDLVVPVLLGWTSDRLGVLWALGLLLLQPVGLLLLTLAVGLAERGDAAPRERSDE